MPQTEQESHRLSLCLSQDDGRTLSVKVFLHRDRDSVLQEHPQDITQISITHLLIPTTRTWTVEFHSPRTLDQEDISQQAIPQLVEWVQYPLCQL